MKYLRLLIAIISFLALSKLHAQASFTLASALCEGSTVSGSVSTGSMSAFAYSWAAIPATGVAFSSSSSQTTNITFSAAGTYTIGAGFLSGSGYSYTFNVIVIDPAPTLSVNPSGAAICSGNSTTLVASGTGLSYAWTPTTALNTSSSNTVIATPTANTIYTVTSAIGNCTLSKTVTISVTPQLTISLVATAASVCAGFTSTLIAFGSSNYTWTSPTLTAPVNQQSIVVGAGSYTVTSGSGTCASSASFAVGSLPDLNISVTSSPGLTTCITNNFPKYSKVVQLVASGAGTYVWFPYLPNQPAIGGTLNVRPSATTCYTVTGSTAICSGSSVVCVTVIPQFTAAVTPPAPVICLGDHQALAIVNIQTLATGPSTAFTFSWTEALNAPPISMSDYFSTTTTVFPQNSTTYSVELKDAVECASLPMQVNVTVNTCTGIDKQNSRAGEFKIYPNPANDKLVIQSVSNSLASIEIIDAVGKIIIKEKRDFSGEGMIQNFSISTLPSGIYFVRITGNTPAKVLRLVKN